MEYNVCLSVRAIKRILRQEDKEARNAVMQIALFQREIVSAGFDLLSERLEACETYDDLDTYIGNTRRMSLDEWVASL